MTKATNIPKPATVSVHYDSANDIYIVEVVNPKLMLVTVKKVIDAPAGFRNGMFGFTATLTDESDPSNPVPVQVSNVIGTNGTDANGQISFTLVNTQTVTLYIPRNTTVQVTERTDAAFTTKVQTGATENGLGSEAVNNTITLSNVSENRFIRFTNELKTINVTVVKTVEGTGGQFNFTAFLRYNGAAVQGYRLANNITTGNGTGGTTAGVASFTLSPENNSTAQVKFTIPSGSRLVLTETGFPTGSEYVTTAVGVGNDSQ